MDLKCSRAALRPDLNHWMFWQADRAEHLVQLPFDAAAQFRHLAGYVLEHEELVRVDGAMLDELRADVGQDAAPDFKSSAGVYVSLKGEVMEMDVLRAGRWLDLD